MTKEQKKEIMEARDARKIRIRNGEIHLFGQMPNTNQEGWYFQGYSHDLEIKGLAGIGIYPAT